MKKQAIPVQDQPADQPGWLNRKAIFVAALSAAILAYVIFRSLGIEPVVMSDEQRFNTYSRLLSPAQAIVPSYLFYFLYRVTDQCGAGFLECGRLLNVLLLGLSSIPLYLICRTYLRKELALFVILAALLGPGGYYATYYMPEILYYLAFLLLMWPLSGKGGSQAKWPQSVAVGVAFGLLSLVKPHAFFLVPAYLALQCYQQISHAGRTTWLARLGTTALSLAVMLAVRFVLGYLIAGKAGADLIGSMYGSVVDKPADPDHLQKLLAIAHVAIGHFYGLLVLFAVPLVSAVIIICQRGGSAQRAKSTIFFATAVLACMLAVTAAYTAQVDGMSKYESINRLHMRYYFFLFPVFVSIGAIFAHGHELRLRPWHRVLAALVLLATMYAGFRGLQPYTPYAVDAPDLWAITTPPLALYGFTALQAAGLVLLLVGQPVWASRWFTYLFVPALLIQSAVAFPTFFSHYREPNVSDQAGIFYEMTIGRRDPVAVVGSDDSQATRTIFHLGGKDIQKVLLPGDARLTPALFFPNIRWIISLGGNPLDPALRGTLAFNMPGYKIWRIGTSPYDVDFSAASWPGVESIQGVSGAENFGRWSDAKQVKIRFTQDFPRQAKLTISAAAFGRNIDEDFTVAIADQVQSFKLGKDAVECGFVFNNIPDGTRDILITVPTPISPQDMGLNADPRKIGIALGHLSLEPL